MDLAEIARALERSDAESRRRAVLAMAGRSEALLGQLLLRALGDQDWRVREEAIRIGRELSEPLGLIPQLIAALGQSENVGLRNASLALLKRIGSAAFGPVMQALPTLDPSPRRMLIEALAHGGDTQVLQMLTEASESADQNLAAAAIEALAAVGGPAAEAVLRRKLRASSLYERIAALDALDRLDAVLPWDELELLLADRVALRVAVRALGRCGRREAIPPLIAALADRSEAVAGAAAVALVRIRNQPALRAELIERVAGAGEVARRRLRTLASRGDDEAGMAAAELLGLPRDASSTAGGRAAPPRQPAAVPDARTSAAARAPRLETEEFRLIADLIRRTSGIKLTDELRGTVERRLSDRLTALAILSFKEYQRYLSSGARGADELERAVEAITTNETYFFRDLPQLRSFEREVLPELYKLSGDRRSLNVWSAGCSTGEEAYTLAILLAGAKLFDGWNLRVFGNDISRRVVQTARKGMYRGSSFRAMPPEYEPYFVKTPEGSWVDPAIRSMCHFARFNLLDGRSATMFGRVDAIFCRNVLIYFDDEARRRVIANFYERLQPSGYLMLGHSDSLLNVTTAFELAHLSGDLAYRKPLFAAGQKP